MAPVTEGPGSVIGRYKILEEIGQGGFGLVFLAEQREPVRRNVALKIIKLGMDTRQVIARFEAERQALAMMDHPHIAKVLDAGTTETGRPYFVMELVRGEPITHYCDKHNVATRERLALFMQVCSAIQHAHQKGVIHRDIKPSNILVTLQDGKPFPKVIDFGIAKALHTRLTEETVFTQHGQLVGTPEYMSPEQAEMSGLDVDTRTDIYSLGAVLYELLTGALPYDPESLRAKGLSEIHRIIREVDPVKPSTRLSSLGDKTDEIARHHAAEIASLQRQIRGDLDWIVLKAMAKDRTRRYETANGLRLDIQRHLDDEPVLARRPSTGYRLSKFVRRNRVGVVSGAVVALGLVLSTVIAVMGMVSALDAANEARRERDAARAARVAEAEQRERAEVAEQDAKQEASRARAVSGFLQDVLAAPSPYREGRDVRVEDLLKLASSSASDALAGQPEEEAIIRRTLGLTYASLGLLAEADIEYQRAIDLFGRAGDEFWRDRARTLLHRARILNEQQRWDELIQLAGPLHEQAKALDPPDAELLEVAALEVAGALRRSQRDPSRAAELYRDALDSQVARLGESDPATMRTMSGLGLCLVELNEFAEGTALLRRVLSYRRRALGEHHPTTLTSMDQVGWALVERQDYSSAERLLREGRDLHRRVWGTDHPYTLQIEMNLARALIGLEQWEDVLAVAQPAFETQRRQFGDEHGRTLALANHLATALIELGRTAELVEVCEIILLALRRNPPAADTSAQELNQYAWDLMTTPCLEVSELRDVREVAEFALPYADRAVARERDTDGNRVWAYLDTLALVHHRRGEHRMAVETQREAIALWPEGSKGVGAARERLRRYEEAQDRSGVKKPPGGAADPVDVVPANLREALGLDPFYDKYIDAEGLPILASREVSDDALRAAHRIVVHMLSKRPEVAEPLRRDKVRIAIIGARQAPTDIPEHRDLNDAFPQVNWDRRTRGVGATRERPACSVGEENLLGLPGDRYVGESILVHEFAHTMAELGIEALDPEFSTRLDMAFDRASEAGLWRDTYAASNVKEYWAEGVQGWFDTNLERPEPDGSHNHVNTRDELVAHDPALAALIAEWLPNDEKRLGYPATEH